MAKFFEVSNLGKKYDGLSVLHGVNLSLGRGEVASIIGPSGAGKTTMLRCLCGLEAADSGEILLDGKTVKMDGSDIGMIFQDLHLWPHRTVLENITDPLVHVKKMSKEEAENKGIALLASFGLENKKDSYPVNLSGGEQQRVAIARALAMKPKAVLMDEITSALDPARVWDMAKIVRSLADEGISVIVVTHNMGFAQKISDEVVFLDGGEVVESGPASRVFGNPWEGKTKEFLNISLDAKE